MKNTKLEEQLLIKLFLILVIKCVLFLTAHLQFLVQGIIVSSEYVDFYTKESRVRISATQLTLVCTYGTMNIGEGGNSILDIYPTVYFSNEPSVYLLCTNSSSSSGRKDFL